MPRYLIFARTRYEEPLALEGELDASDDQSAAELARRRVGEDTLELQLVPQAAVRWVIGPSEQREQRQEVASV